MEGGGRDPKKIKNLVPLFKKEKNKKSRQPRTQAPVRALLVQGSRVKYKKVPFDGPVVTVIYWYKLNQKMRSKLQK